MPLHPLAISVLIKAKLQPSLNLLECRFALSKPVSNVPRIIARKRATTEKWQKRRLPSQSRSRCAKLRLSTIISPRD